VTRALVGRINRGSFALLCMPGVVVSSGQVEVEVEVVWWRAIEASKTVGSLNGTAAPSLSVCRPAARAARNCMPNQALASYRTTTGRSTLCTTYLTRKHTADHAPHYLTQWTGPDRTGSKAATRGNPGARKAETHHRSVGDDVT
jgi:hypothetical protein